MLSKGAILVWWIIAVIAPSIGQPDKDMRTSSNIFYHRESILINRTRYSSFGFKTNPFCFHKLFVVFS